MTEQDLSYYISLTLIPGVGPVLAKQLLAYCGSPQQVFRYKREQLKRIPGIGEVTAEAVFNFDGFERAEQELDFARRHQIRVLPYTHPDYPERLRQTDDGPLVLYVLGKGELNAHRMIAVVGTRKCTEYGKEFCQQLLEELKNSGCTVVSGLAYGIDIIAHRAALQQALPTMAVLAHGLHTIYPSTHRGTARKMIENGGLITEFMSGQDADRENFPKRNRIVAGMCDATVVVETALKGGAMITADIANSYNRDVYAVPGRVNDPLSAGCNHLVKTQKAAMIESATDLLYMLGWDEKERKNRLQKPGWQNLSLQEQSIVNLFNGIERLGIDDISYQLQEESSSIALLLLDMEFKGIIRSLPGKYYQLLQP